MIFQCAALPATRNYFQVNYICSGSALLVPLSSDGVQVFVGHHEQVAPRNHGKQMKTPMKQYMDSLVWGLDGLLCLGVLGFCLKQQFSTTLASALHGKTGSFCPHATRCWAYGPDST